MDKEKSSLQKILAQLEGLSYRDADYVLVCAREKLKDCSAVHKYIPNKPESEDKLKRRESTVEFDGEMIERYRRSKI